MSDRTIDRRSGVECRFDGGFLALHPITAECGPSGRAAGDEATKQHDQGERDELDTKAR
ncbi:MAG: hypothetical protein JF589_01625 [Gemmatimonadetes bacterium]|nr:hypothetical protein [Gemmatimonadota bacterium]